MMGGANERRNGVGQEVNQKKIPGATKCGKNKLRNANHHDSDDTTWGRIDMTCTLGVGPQESVRCLLQGGRNVFAENRYNATCRDELLMVPSSLDEQWCAGFACGGWQAGNPRRNGDARANFCFQSNGARLHSVHEVLSSATDNNR